MKKKVYLVTGCSGFIGFHVCKSLLNNNFVVGIDNMNKYYDLKLKLGRLSILRKNKNFSFYKRDICNFKEMNLIFKKFKFFKIIHLAAQAGVRYSLVNPKKYIDTNIYGFFNILELVKKYKIKHLVFASSSSIYGKTNKVPFKENHLTDNPLQIYATTKKSNELMAYCYSSLYNLSITGLRFFTVYGPWGRPDMAIYIFTKKILSGKKVEIFNKGNHSRDFTYIKDIVSGIIKSLRINKKNKKFEIYNIGNSKPEKILKVLNIIEKNLCKKAKIKFLKKQPGDMVNTYSDISRFKKKFNFKPKIKIEDGIKFFLKWYSIYHNKK